MNLYWQFKAAYKIGKDFEESKEFGFRPLASRYYRIVSASYSLGILIDLARSKFPLVTFLQKRCKGVIPILFYALKSLILFLKNFISFKEGNFIKKCWIPHFLKLYVKSFLLSTTCPFTSHPSSVK